MLTMLKNDSPDLREAMTFALANLSSGNMNNCTYVFICVLDFFLFVLDVDLASFIVSILLAQRL